MAEHGLDDAVHLDILRIGGFSDFPGELIFEPFQEQTGGFPLELLLGQAIDTALLDQLPFLKRKVLRF